MISSRAEWMSCTDVDSGRVDRMWRKTREFAQSGACANWQEIETKLDQLGYPSASQGWSLSFRTVLDRLCATAAAGPPVAA